MKLGIDTYSFHRIFGDRRGGEAESARRFPRGSLDAIDIAARIGADSIALQTLFLDFPSPAGIAALRGALDGLEPVVAWGHPDGLAFGTATRAAAELERWIEVAPELGCELVRFVAGNSSTDRGGRPIEFLAAALERPLQIARDCGVALALENHADLTLSELETLVALVADPTLGICLDTANALRVGDGPLDATLRLLPHLRILHLKDVDDLAFDRSVGPRSVAYGTGIVPVAEILAVLADGEFEGHVMVELGYLGAGDVDEEALVEECFAWLLDARGRLQ
jgi:sugar phosphate isomerase/epimerase